MRRIAKLPSANPHASSIRSLAYVCQRGEMFGAMAIVAVTHDSIDFGEDCDRHRVLRDVYKWLDRIAGELCEIADDVKGDVA